MALPGRDWAWERSFVSGVMTVERTLRGAGGEYPRYNPYTKRNS